MFSKPSRCDYLLNRLGSALNTSILTWPICHSDVEWGIMRAGFVMSTLGKPFLHGSWPFVQNQGGSL